MADEFGGFAPDFNFDFGFGFDPAFAVPDFNFQFPAFDLPPMDFGFQFDPAWFSDPMARPSRDMPVCNPVFNQTPFGMQDFSQFGIPDPGQQFGAPQTLADLGYGGTGAPTVPMQESFTPGSDPLLNML